MKTWVISKNNRLHLSYIHVSGMDVDKTVDIARGQRIAEVNARQLSWQSKMICSNLVEEICSGISQKAVVMDWLKEMLDEAWVEVEAREIWGMMGTSQPIQVRVLGMLERQEMEAAEMERRKTDILAKK